MVGTVVLVRHAMPQVDRDRPPADWPLTPPGRAAAVALAVSLPGTAALVSSPERKAVETVALAYGMDPAAVVVDQRFGEVARPGEGFDDDVRAGRRAWIEGRADQRHHRWETPAGAADRFAAGVAALGGGTAVVGTHGMVMTAWLHALGAIGAGKDAGRFWASLRFPELVVVEVAAGRIVERWAPRTG